MISSSSGFNVIAFDNQLLLLQDNVVYTFKNPLLNNYAVDISHYDIQEERREFIPGQCRSNVNLSFSCGKVDLCENIKLTMVYKELAKKLTVEQLFKVIKEKVQERNPLQKG